MEVGRVKLHCTLELKYFGEDEKYFLEAVFLQ